MNNEAAQFFADAVRAGRQPGEAARDVARRFPDLPVPDFTSAIRQGMNAGATMRMAAFAVARSVDGSAFPQTAALAMDDGAIVADAVYVAHLVLVALPASTPKEIAVALKDPRNYPNLTAWQMALVLHDAQTFPNITAAQLTEALTAAAYTADDVKQAVDRIFPPQPKPDSFALAFNGNKDGSGSYARVADSATLHLDAQLTLEARVYWNGGGGYLGCVSKPRSDGGRAGTGYTLALAEGKPMLGIITASGQNRAGAIAASALRVNTWAMVSMTYDGRRSVTYVDGVEVGRSEWPNQDPVAQGNSGLLLGREFLTDLVDRAFGGCLSDVRIWNQALSAETIAAWWSKTPLEGHPNSAALAGRWLLNDGAGAVASDSSGHNQPATLANGAAWQAYPASVPAIDPALAAWWLLSADANDYSGHNRHGEFIGGTIVPNARGQSGAANLGIGGAIRVPRIDVARSDFTFAAWIKLNALDNRSILFGDWVYEWQLLLAVVDGGCVGANLRRNINSGGSDPAQDLINLRTSPRVPLNQWCHVAVTWNRESGVCTGFIGGVAMGTAKPQPSNERDLQINNHPYYWIGRKEDGSDASSWLHGMIGDVRLYTRALDANEIGRLAQG